MKSICSSTSLEAFEQIVRIHRLIAILGISRSTAYGRMDPSSAQYDPNFPKPIRLNSASKRGAVGWLASEVEAYIAICAGRGRNTSESLTQLRGGV